MIIRIRSGQFFEVLWWFLLKEICMRDRKQTTTHGWIEWRKDGKSVACVVGWFSFVLLVSLYGQIKDNNADTKKKRSHWIRWEWMLKCRLFITKASFTATGQAKANVIESSYHLCWANNVSPQTKNFNESDIFWHVPRRGTQKPLKWASFFTSCRCEWCFKWSWLNGLDFVSRFCLQWLSIHTYSRTSFERQPILF